MLNIRTRYVLRQIIQPLIAAMAIGLSVLLAERLVRLLDITLGKKNSISVVFEMLAYLVPHYLGLAMPAAFFLGLLFGFNRLSRDSEVDAFLAGGVGLHQLTVPVLILSIAFSGLGMAIFGFLQPHTRYAFRSIIHQVKNVQIFYLAEEGVFMRAAKHTFIVDKLGRKENKFQGIFVYTEKPDGETQTITAKGGALIEVEGEPRPVLRLERGHRLSIGGKIDHTGKGPLPRQTAGEFSLVDTPLGAVEETIFRNRGSDRRELTLPELFTALDDPPKGEKRQSIVSELHRRIIAILTILLLPILAVPFAVQRGRHQKPYGFAIGFLILAVYNEVLEQGALLVRAQGLSPLIALWLPFALLAIFSIWRYYTHCFRLRADVLDAVMDRVAMGVSWARQRIMPSGKNA